jgi:hypothetical protein
MQGHVTWCYDRVNQAGVKFQFVLVLENPSRLSFVCLLFRLLVVSNRFSCNLYILYPYAKSIKSMPVCLFVKYIVARRKGTSVEPSCALLTCLIFAAHWMAFKGTGWQRVATVWKVHGDGVSPISATSDNQVFNSWWAVVGHEDGLNMHDQADTTLPARGAGPMHQWFSGCYWELPGPKVLLTISGNCGTPTQV